MSAPFSYTSIYFDSPPIKERAADIWIPNELPLRPRTLVFVHGGGWQAGHREQMHTVMWGFLEKGYVCVSLDYRLGGVTVPVQLADVREGMALADAHLREQGIAQPVVLYGSSAGGHLALLAGLAPCGACGDAFEGKTPAVAGIVSSCAPVTFVPWDEIFPGSRESFSRAAGVTYEENPEQHEKISPEQYISADSPPVFFLLGECEHMFPNALTIALASRLQALGVPAEYRVYPAAEHGFFYSFERKSQQQAFRDMLAFVDGLTDAQSSGEGESR